MVADAQRDATNRPSADLRTTYGNFLRGASWTVASRWGLRFIGLLSTMVMARLLTPADYGIVAMAAMVRGLLDHVTRLGVSMLVIRERDSSRDFYDTAWSMQVLQNTLIGLLLVAAAPVASAYFREAVVSSVLYVFAAASVVEGFTNIGIPLLRKELDFARDFRFLLFGRLFAAAATVSLGLVLRNYWALVFGELLATLFTVALSFRVHPYRPRPCFRRASQFLRFAASVIPNTVGGFLSAKVDVVIVGGVATAARTGAYSVASEMSAMTTSEVVVSAGRSFLPNYAKISDDRSKLGTVFSNVLGAMWTLGVALGLGLFAVAPEFVAVVLGAQWTESIPLVQWLAVRGVFGVLHRMTGGQILIALGAERLAAILTWFRLAVLAALTVAASRMGTVETIAAAVALSAAVTAPVPVLLLSKLLDLELRRLASVLWRPVVSGALMVGALAMLPEFTTFSLLSLFTKTIAGGVVYVASLGGLWIAAGRPEGPEAIFLDEVSARRRHAKRREQESGTG